MKDASVLSTKFVFEIKTEFPYSTWSSDIQFKTAIQ